MSFESQTASLSDLGCRSRYDRSPCVARRTSVHDYKQSTVPATATIATIAPTTCTPDAPELDCDAAAAVAADARDAEDDVGMAVTVVWDVLVEMGTDVALEAAPGNDAVASGIAAAADVTVWVTAPAV